MKALAVALVLSVILLAGTSSYSSWVASTNHRNSCISRGLVLDTFRDVIVLALTPQPGQKLTAKQAADIAAFETKAFMRIDQARC